jgi:hypothetical protein
MYRSYFELTNRGKASYRADITIPSPMKKYIEVNPNTMFVQAGGKQSVNIKFTPTLDMLSDLAYFTVPDTSFVNTCRLGIPIEVKVCVSTICARLLCSLNLDLMDASHFCRL